MNVALIGATGFIGSGLLKELLSRGHRVTALVAHPEKLSPHANVTAARIDVLDTATLGKQLKGHDAVISAFSGHAQPDVYDYYIRGIHSIVAASKAAKAPRFLVVGGAGSLEVSPGVQVVDTPEFPAAWKASALGAREALRLLRNEKDLNWTMLSPSAIIAPGQRTGKFRLGGDQLLVKADGKSEISLEDYAVAMIDELERPAHPRKRFTVGY
ncbi:MAG TPA: NAD(P)-dependent oxidoreductase [Nitrospirota bacterium]|nr:NAD(P)-dependent oxidoreductase [Nitrospirota bacterium]